MQARMAVMQQYDTEDAMVLLQIFEDRTAQSENLTRLARSKPLQHAYSTMFAPREDSAWSSRGLNEAAADTYSIIDSAKFALSAVLETRTQLLAMASRSGV